MSTPAVRFRQDEVDAAWLYNVLAEIESDPRLSEVYRRLGATEAAHARVWAERTVAEGGVAPSLEPSRRARVLARLARRFGPQFVLPTLIGQERGSARTYGSAGSPESSALAAQERSRARVLRALSGTAGIEGSTLARLEGRHRAVGGNALRAAVLGANDGLVSNLSLVMGVAGPRFPATPS